MSNKYSSISTFILLLTCAIFAGCQSQRMSPIDRTANSCDSLGKVLRFPDSYQYAAEVLLGGNPGPAVPRRVQGRAGRIAPELKQYYTVGDLSTMASAISRCDDAISNLRVAENWMRKATMLRARGVYHLADGDRNSAIRDFQEARQIIAEAGDPAELQHGFIITLNLLLSASYDGHLNRYAARDSIHTWLLDAAKAYPYSDRLHALVIRRLSASYLSGHESEVYRQQVAALSPKLLNEIADVEAWFGGPQRAYDLHQTLTRSASNDAPIARELILSHAKSAALAAQMGQFTVAEDHQLRASQLLEQYAADYQTAHEQNPDEYTGIGPDGLQVEITGYEHLVKGYKSNETASEDALRQYLEESQPFLAVGSTFHLLRAIENKRNLRFTNTTGLNTMFAGSRLNLEELDKRALVQEICELTPLITDMQLQSGLNPVGSNRASKHSGSKVTQLGEHRLEVEYSREGAGAAQVQELAILKAAMVATEKGKEGFYVEDEQNYRFIKNFKRGTSTLWGPTVGYRTKITVRLIDKADVSAGFGESVMLEASQVVGELGSKYL